MFTGRYTQLFTVPVKGGVEVALPIPNASRGSYNADGTRIAYNPLNPAHLQWKRYRGGSAGTIVLYDPKTHATEKVAQPATRANDVDPQWLGGGCCTSGPIATASSTCIGSTRPRSRSRA